jgi:hypothetical protein
MWDALCALRCLREINLAHSRAEFCLQLEGPAFQHVETINLRGYLVCEAFVASLVDAPRLYGLGICDTTVSDDICRVIARTRVRILDLAMSRVSAAGLGTILTMPHLRCLVLDASKAYSDRLPEMIRNSSLTDLELGGRLPTALHAAIAEANPNLRFRFHGKLIRRAAREVEIEFVRRTGAGGGFMTESIEICSVVDSYEGALPIGDVFLDIEAANLKLSEMAPGTAAILAEDADAESIRELLEDEEVRERVGFVWTQFSGIAGRSSASNWKVRPSSV